MLPSARGLLELEGCSSTPLNGGTKCAGATSAKRRALRTFQVNMSEENKEALREAKHTCQSVVDSARLE